MFTEIFGMAIETILCCFIADEEMFPVEKRFAEGALKSALQKHAEKANQVLNVNAKVVLYLTNLSLYTINATL